MKLEEFNPVSVESNFARCLLTLFKTFFTSALDRGHWQVVGEVDSQGLQRECNPSVLWLAGIL